MVDLLLRGLSAAVLALWLSACGPPRPPPAPVAPSARLPTSPALETIRATRWVSTSAEFDALSIQAWAAAERALTRALADSSWTAAVEQEGGAFRDLPPAVILDVDETVLDNSRFQERMIRLGSEFDPVEWARWVEAAEAEAVPGALAFARRAAQLGVAVFYVTNRDAELEEPTRRNLVERGFPVSAVHDAILTRGERAGWESDKSSRRSHVAEDHRILLLGGDDLNDFLPAVDLSIEARRRLVEEHRDRWGERWIVLANPVYGSWLDALED